MSVELIAEISTNHGGSVALAKEFIDAFAPSADTIKFQLTRVAHLRRSDPQHEWFQQAELSLEQFADLKAYTESKGCQLLLTVYNAADLWELHELGLTRVKIGSGEASDVRLADAVAVCGVNAVIVSCGLSPYVRFMEYRWPLSFSVAHLGCVTRYPAPPGMAAAWYAHARWRYSDQPFPIQGWSDHAKGLNECKTAICCGAKIVETHVWLPNQARPVRSYEKSIAEMAELRVFADEDPTRFIGRWQA